MGTTAATTTFPTANHHGERKGRKTIMTGHVKVTACSQWRRHSWVVTEDDVTGIVRTALHDHGTSDVEERWAYACDGTYLSLFQKPKRAHPQDTSLIPVGYPPLNVLRFSSVPNKITTGGKKKLRPCASRAVSLFLDGSRHPTILAILHCHKTPCTRTKPHCNTYTHTHTYIRIERHIHTYIMSQTR